MHIYLLIVRYTISYIFSVTFQYHSQKSTSSRFRVLSGSCLTAGGHAALFINQVCIMLVNSFVIPGGIMNRVGQEAQACAFSCFRAHNIIVCSSGVCSVPFFALAISRAPLNSGLSREHMCCHVFLPAHVFPRGCIAVSHLHYSSLKHAKYCRECRFPDILWSYARLLISFYHIQFGAECSSRYIMMYCVLIWEGCYILPRILILLSQIEHGS